MANIYVIGTGLYAAELYVLYATVQALGIY
jgi:hypothetical protein